MVLLRHGQTDMNVGRRFQGTSDHPLNERGRSQARAAGEVLAARLTTPSKQVGVFGAQHRAAGVRVVSSPLSRAVETAGIVSESLATRGVLVGGPMMRAGLIERAYGDFEGHDIEEVRALWPDALAQWQDGGESEDAGVEPASRVGARMRDAVLDLAGECGGGETLLVVSHGGAISRGVVSLLGLDAGVFQGLRGLDNCHWAEMVPDPRGPHGWRLASYNIGTREDVLGA